MSIGDLIELLVEPLRYSFILRGLIASIMVGVVSAIVGSFVVVRGMAFFGDALAHSILPGVAAAYLIGGPDGPLFCGGLAAGVVTALGIGWLTRGDHIKEDTAIGVVFAGTFALGIAIISTVRSYSADLMHILFGNVLGVGDDDLMLMIVFGGLVVVTVVLLYKELLVVSFDPTLAHSLRLPVDTLRLLLLVLIAVTIVASLQTVGVALMVAMLVTPAATAYLFVRRLHHMMMLAAVIGAFSSAVGLYLSYYVAVASGAAIVLVATVIFALAFIFAPERGRIWVLLSRHRSE